MTNLITRLQAEAREEYEKEFPDNSHVCTCESKVKSFLDSQIAHAVEEGRKSGINELANKLAMNHGELIDRKEGCPHCEVWYEADELLSSQPTK